MNERTEEEVTVKTAKSRERPLSLSVSVLPCCSERALFFWPPLISKLEKIAQKGRGEKEATLQSWSEKGNPDSASGFAKVKKERRRRMLTLGKHADGGGRKFSSMTFLRTPLRPTTAAPSTSIEEDPPSPRGHCKSQFVENKLCMEVS